MRRSVLLLATLTLAGCATASPAPPPVGAAGPASTAPAPSGSAPAAAAASGSPAGAAPSSGPTARACTAGDLPGSATLGDDNGAAGTALHYVVVVNRGSTRCTLAGYPALASIDSTGRVTAVPADQGSPFDPSADFGTPATIDPGQPARVLVTSSLSCNGGANPTTYRDLALVAAGTRIRIPGLVLETTCPLRVGAWYQQSS
jgi:hypothetical protein